MTERLIFWGAEFVTPCFQGVDLHRIREDLAVEFVRCSDFIEDMNTTSRGILKMLLSSDQDLTRTERALIEQLMSGRVPSPPEQTSAPRDERVLTQGEAAKFLSVSRVTIWRMAKQGLLNPVEILPGTLRYPLEELTALVGRSSGANAIRFSPGNAA